MKCFNCGCIQTPLWRRGPGGEQLCNACGIYYKNHGTHRSMPVKMKTASMLAKKQAALNKNGAASSQQRAKKKTKKQKQPVMDFYDMMGGKQDSEAFAAHVLIKLSYDVYMMAPHHHHVQPTAHQSAFTPNNSYHNQPMHMSRSRVSSPYEAHTPPPQITATV